MKLEGLCTVIDKETEEIEREIEGINRERKVRTPWSVCLVLLFATQPPTAR